MDLQATYNQINNRPPGDREIFLHEGELAVYRGMFPSGRWESLGASVEEGVPPLGLLDFEMGNGIIARGTPTFVMKLMLRAFEGIEEKRAAEVVSTIYNIFRECGWRGPAESDDRAIPGSVDIDETVYDVDDIRVIYAQLQDPEFNGWLSFESERTPETPSCTTFVSVGNARQIRLRRAVT